MKLLLPLGEFTLQKDLEDIAVLRDEMTEELGPKRKDKSIER